jgi:hypothetical protein
MWKEGGYLMNENKTSLGKLLSLFLLLFFFVIVLFVLFSVLNINDFKVFPAVLTFSIINFIILLVVIGGGSELIEKIGVASYISICFVTVIFTLLQFVYLGFGYQSEAIISYILYHLIILFVYFVIIIPIVLMGIKNNSK